MSRSLWPLSYSLICICINGMGSCLFLLMGKRILMSFIIRPTADFWNGERKARSIALLKKGILYIGHLKAAVYEAECRIPDKGAVIHRLCSVFAAAVQSEVYVNYPSRE